jgi:hypothetical protein
MLQFAVGVDKSRINRVYVNGETGAVGAASVQILAPGELNQKLSAWRRPDFLTGTTSRKVAPGATTIAVLNGGGRLLGGDDLVEALNARGYKAFSAGNTNQSNYADSAVYFSSNREDAGYQVGSLLGKTAAIRPLPKDLVVGSTGKLIATADLVVVSGASFHGLATPKAANAKPAPPRRADTVATLALVPVLRPIAGTGVDVLVPTKVARDSRVRNVRTYRVDGRYPAVKMVFETGYRKYWAIEEMGWKSPPILLGRTGTVRKCKTTFSTFYDGKNMMRLAWQRGGSTFWISNSIDYALTAESIYDIACNMQPAARAALRPGVRSTPMSIRTTGDTP